MQRTRKQLTKRQQAEYVELWTQLWAWQVVNAGRPYPENDIRYDPDEGGTIYRLLDMYRGNASTRQTNTARATGLKANNLTARA
jgi:hypothetical protein